jgi:hypothetical protein
VDTPSNLRFETVEKMQHEIRQAKTRKQAHPAFNPFTKKFDATYQKAPMPDQGSRWGADSTKVFRLSRIKAPGGQVRSKIPSLPSGTGPAASGGCLSHGRMLHMIFQPGRNTEKR